MYLSKETCVYHFTSLRKELYISEFGHSKNWNKFRVSPYSRNVFIIDFVVDGGYNFCDTYIEKGHGCFITQKKVHSMEGSIRECYWIGFDGNAAVKLMESIGFSRDDHGVFEIRALPYVTKVLKTAFVECSKEQNEEIALSALMSILPFITVEKGVEPVERGYFEAAVSIMKRNHYRVLSMESIAKKVNISEKHLCKIFKAKCGMSPKKYLTKLRMEAAKKMILESELRIKEIAEIEGYSSQGAFSQAFTAYFGISPSEMKANNS